MSKDKKLVLDDSKKLESVKLVYGGLKGMVISYSEDDNRRDIGYKNVFNGVKFGAPSSGDLINCFGELRGHLLDIFGYPIDGDDRKILMNNVEVTGVSYTESRGFVITGVLNVLDGKQVNLVSPLIVSGEDYVGYQEVAGIIHKIYDETKEYLNGNKRMTPLQYMEGLNSKHALKGFDRDEFLSKGHDEQLQLAIDFAEKAGCMVLKPSDVEVNGEVKEVAVPVLKVEKTVKEVEVKKEVTMSVNEEEDFGI